MEKRLLLLLCFLSTGLHILKAQKFTAINAEGVEIKYEVTSASEKTVQVTGGERPDELIIHATVVHDGTTYRVTAIKKGAYMPSTTLVHRIRRLVLPEGLVEIGNNAFHTAFMSDGNESIYIPSTVKIIGKNAVLERLLLLRLIQ